jgi:DNA replication protein DnaC
MSPALVVLDDVGAERASEYAQQILFEAIDGRYAQHLPMIVTTNLSREALASKGQSVKNRTYERLLEVCLPIEVDAGRRRYSAESYEQMRLAFTGAE